MKDKFFLSFDGGKNWVEVTEQQWVSTERGCGFRGGRDGEPATGGFTSGGTIGSIGTPPAVLNGRGRILLDPAKVAQELRDELVCCDTYEVVNALYDPKDMTKYRAKLRSGDYHAICHYGEWAARIVERMGGLEPGRDSAAG